MRARWSVSGLVILAGVAILYLIIDGSVLAEERPAAKSGLQVGALVEVVAEEAEFKPGSDVDRLPKGSIGRIERKQSPRMWIAVTVEGTEHHGWVRQADVAPAAAAQRKAADRLRSIYRAKTKPEAGDWLAAHPETGQSLDQYLVSNPNRPSRELTTLYVQPIGQFDKVQTELIVKTADLLKRCYGVPTRTLAAMPAADIPGRARRKNENTGAEQLLTTYLLDEVLKPRRPDDAVALLGLTAADLWPGEGWNFVFGQASLGERVGVWSMARYGDPAPGGEQYALSQSRTFKVAVHETGHMLGIKHCTAYECVMNGANSLEETDRGELAFCPECAAKIWWACRLEPGPWYRSLADFADANNLKTESALWKKSLQAIQTP